MSVRARIVGVVFAGVFLTGCGAQGDRPGVVVFPGMVQSVPYDPHDPHPVFGQTLRLPPAGTVPYHAPVPQFDPGEGEAIRAGRELVNPRVATPADVARGAKLFTTYCLVCHGPKGEGDGPIIGRFPNPPSLLADHAKELPDGRVWHIITHGQGLMPGHGTQVLAADRWLVIAHLRSLQGLDGPVPADTSTVPIAEVIAASAPPGAPTAVIGEVEVGP